MNTNQTNDNIWDRIFKTLFLETPELFLPLINEAFHESYDKTATITSLNNEFYNKDGSKIISDTTLMVNHIIYHFECQFSNDKEMVFRMFEYDFQIGLSNAKQKKCIDEFDFPKSCVVYITTNKNNPTTLPLKINFPNGSFLYEVPTIRVHDYSLENINKKKLLIFLPYLALKYPQKLKNKYLPTKEEIIAFYQEMLDLLETAYSDTTITIQEYNALLEAIKEAEQRVFNNYTDIKKEVDSMVRNTLELKSFKMRDEAVTEAVTKTTIDMLRQMEKVGTPMSNIIAVAKLKNISEEKLYEILGLTEKV